MGGQHAGRHGAPLIAAIESGGTKVVCLVGTGPGDILAECTLPTDRPEVALAKVVDFIRASERDCGQVAAIGLASFGPVDLDADSPTFGHVTRTPKAGWSGVDVVGWLRKALDRPVAFDTDVNGAGIGEYEWGAGRGLDNFVYVTIGTGIGGGIILGGKPLRGLWHPELGHIRPRRDPDADSFAGICPFHGDCLEGLASGSAIVARWNKTLEELGPDHPALRLEADYLAQLCVELTYIVSPQRIILGGGVASASGLLAAVRQLAAGRLGNYLSHPVLSGKLESYIVPPGLGKRAGVLGALAMAQRLMRAGK
jgi:fructokinase